MGCSESTRSGTRSRWRALGSLGCHEPVRPLPADKQASDLAVAPKADNNEVEKPADAPPFLMTTQSSSSSSNSVLQLSGPLMTTPILIVNMGAEMVFIFEQRLQAQKLPDARRQKVVQEVVKTLCYPRFVEELFKPQEMYTRESMRQIFDRLAHSSSMRLNEASMNKLFTITAMAFKYQLIACRTPEEMLDIVTVNHFDALKGMVGSDAKDPTQLLEECAQKMRATCTGLPSSELNLLRQVLCAFFQDWRVKVSLFLQDQMQNPDGSIIVSNHGILPEGREELGTVKYFEGGVEKGTERLTLVSTSTWKSAAGARSTLGANLYVKDRGSPLEFSAGSFVSRSGNDSEVAENGAVAPHPVTIPVTDNAAASLPGTTMAVTCEQAVVNEAPRAPSAENAEEADHQRL